jgi:transposase
VTLKAYAVPMSGHGTEERYIVTADARRRWSRAEKLAMVSEIGENSVSAIARKHNIAPSLLFRWKREFGSSGPAGSVPTEPTFVRVALPTPVTAPECAFEPVDRMRDGAIEIVLCGNRRIIVGRGVDAIALKRVLCILEDR